MNKNSGVSLVVLVVTIVVLIILSSVVVLNISGQDGQISVTQRAKIENDIITFSDELQLNLSKNPRENLNELNIDEVASNEEERIKMLFSYIPSMKNGSAGGGVEYSSILTIKNGELMLYDDSTLESKGITLEKEVKEAITKHIETFR